MIPLKIKPFFKTDYIKNDITSGRVNCCETNAFNIYYNGEVEKNIILGTYLSEDNDSISLSAKCLKCGHLIKIFDSHIDGCDANCEDDNTLRTINKNNVKDKLFNVFTVSCCLVTVTTYVLVVLSPAVTTTFILLSPTLNVLLPVPVTLASLLLTVAPTVKLVTL